jgi:hypothetical protein
VAYVKSLRRELRGLEELEAKKRLGKPQTDRMPLRSTTIQRGFARPITATLKRVEPLEVVATLPSRTTVLPTAKVASATITTTVPAVNEHIIPSATHKSTPSTSRKKTVVVTPSRTVKSFIPAEPIRRPPVYEYDTSDEVEYESESD